MRPSLSIVIPCLNEQKNIAATYKEVSDAISRSQIEDYEILCLDDCSQDDTFAEMKKLQDTNPRVRSFRNERNLGLGGSYKRGMELATKEFYVLIPGDNAWPSDGMVEIFRRVGEADIVIPYLVSMGDKGPARRFLSRGFVVFVNSLFGFDVRYYNGLVVHRLQNLRKIKILTDSFAYQAEALVKALKMGQSYVQVACNTMARPGGKSKALRIANLVRCFSCIIGLRLKAFRYGTELYQH